jgi:hypothetical protein
MSYHLRPSLAETLMSCKTGNRVDEYLTKRKGASRFARYSYKWAGPLEARSFFLLPPKRQAHRRGADLRF